MCVYGKQVEIYEVPADMEMEDYVKEIKKECVNHPEHYQGNGIETIDVIEAFDLNFNLGNAIKYILRSGRKGNKKEDIQKAIWYLSRELEKQE